MEIGIVIITSRHQFVSETTTATSGPAPTPTFGKACPNFSHCCMNGVSLKCRLKPP